MFSKSRRKIVIAIMAVLLLFLTVTLVVINITSSLSVRRENMAILERYVTNFRLDAQGEGLPEFSPAAQGEGLPEPHQGMPGEPGDGGPFGPDGIRDPGDTALFRLSSFYSAAFSGEGEVLFTDVGVSALYSEDEIISLSEELIRSGKTSGQTGDLLYRIVEKDGYTLAAFMDVTLTENSMGRVLTVTLVTGIVSAVLLFIASIFLARWIIRPLEENDQKQKRFISDAGHELKTPVSVISTNAELLSRQLGRNEWLSNIQYENERMGGLVKDLLMLSRAESAAFQPERVDLSRLTEQEILPFESVAFEQGLLIRSDLEEGVVVLGNPGQLCQLVSILTDNAISHAEGGEHIDVSLRTEHKHAVLRVSNRGTAIPEEKQAHLFDRFYRMDEAREDAGGHFGLGLSIAKAITDAHKGKISVSCGEGLVTFTVQISLEK